MSYIGKNPKVDSVKLDGSAAVPTGASVEGQVYYNTGTGSISKGLKVYKNSQFVSIDKQLGDADTFHLLKASDLSVSEWSGARNSTSTSFLNQNSVPFETTTASGVAGTFSNSSTGDALLTDESADLVFAYKSSGTSDDAQEYFGIPLTIPKAFRGGNIVLSFVYRTENDGSAATLDGQFEVGILDKSTGNGGQTTSTNSTTDIAAGAAITVASKTGLAVNQRIRLEAGSQAAIGSPDATVVEAYITSVSSTANEITISEAWDTPHAAGAAVVSGWLTDVVPGQLPGADSDTDKQGKSFKLQFKTEDDTSDIVLWFQNKNTSSTDSFELFVDNILLSANKFLQASSQTKSESYTIINQADMWDGSGGSTYTTFDTSLIVPGPDTPPLAESKLIEVTDFTGPGTIGTVTGVRAKQAITLHTWITAYCDNSGELFVIDSSEKNLCAAYAPNSAAAGYENVNASINLAKDDYIFYLSYKTGSRTAAWGALATPQTSDVILLESQDEIFTDWTAFTPTGTWSTNTTYTGQWRRVGGDMEVKVKGTMGGAPNSSTLGVDLPSGYTIDTSKVLHTVDESNFTFGQAWFTDSGTGGGGTDFTGLVGYENSSTVALAATYIDGSGGEYVKIDPVSQGVPWTWNANQYWTAHFKVPIQGWNANFNPLLSMPLVEIGANTEEYRYNNVDQASSKTYRLIGRSTGTEIVNTISNLGTVNNDTANGWYFQANQRVKVSISAGYSRSTSIAGQGIVKYPASYGSPSTAPNNAWGAADWNIYMIGGGQDTHGSGYQGNVAASFIMEANDYVQILQDGNDNTQNSGKAGIQLLVEKDFSNTNMAHIIKPAVAVIKDVKAYNVGGGTSPTTWTARVLNTFEGETWFVTPGTGTTGLGGTCASFTLDPGQYEVLWTEPILLANQSQSRLYNVTDSTIMSHGVGKYCGSTTWSQDAVGGYTTFTITSAKEIALQTHVETSYATYGLGYRVDQLSTDNTNPSVYSQVLVRKLK